MVHRLTKRERIALKKTSTFYGKDSWVPKDKFSEVGPKTLGKLLELGLVRKKQDKEGRSLYQMAEIGWVCMYGLCHDEIMKGSGLFYPLRIQEWPRRQPASKTQT